MKIRRRCLQQGHKLRWYEYEGFYACRRWFCEWTKADARSGE